MNPGPPFEAFGTAHLTVIALTMGSPVALAAVVRRSRWRALERGIAISLSALLLINYCAYLFFVRHFKLMTWPEALPLQLCDWAMVVIIIALLTRSQRWFEVAYFWGIGGTLQAILTPNLPFGFPDLRFVSFFVAHCVIVVGIIYMMLVHKHRPYPISIVRAFLWAELYFFFTYATDRLTGVNYGFLLHKPEAFSLLSFLSDSPVVYLFQMHLLAIVFFCVLYLPFAIYDFGLARRLAGKV
jgi:hypothetical integral membrane protein (TIGR02206 family)